MTGEWSDAGDTMWLACTLWGTEAEHYAGILTKGRRVTVWGNLTIRNYQTQQGEARQSLDVRVNGIQAHEPRQQPANGYQSPAQGQGGRSGGYGAPAPQNGTQGGHGRPLTDEPPF